VGIVSSKLMTTISADSPAVQQGATWLVRLGRLGYIAKGLVYVVVGFLATKAAIGIGGETTDTKGALRAIGEAPFGRIALVVVAVGLIGYMGWRLASAVTDAEPRGSDARGLALRLGDAFRGVVYGSLGAWVAAYVVRGHAESKNQTRAVTDQVLQLPAGRSLVIGAGLVIFGYALYQLYRAVTRKFLKRLDLSSAGERKRKWIERLGGFGIGARAAVFAMIGLLIARAGWKYDPSEAGGIDKSLDVIASQPFGSALFAVVASGLIAFGVLQFATARYRVMRATQGPA
jgi:hypothetical protein